MTAAEEILGKEDAPELLRKEPASPNWKPRTIGLSSAKALPIEQKLQIMEAIWEDLRARFDRLEVSQQQKDLLDLRRARVRDGAAQLMDWESVKGTSGRS